MLNLGLGLAAGVLVIGLFAEFWRRRDFDLWQVRCAVLKLLALATLLGVGGPVVFTYSQNLLAFGLWCAVWPLVGAPTAHAIMGYLMARRGKQAWRGAWPQKTPG